MVNTRALHTLGKIYAIFTSERNLVTVNVCFPAHCSPSKKASTFKKKKRKAFRGLSARLQQVRWLFFPILNLLTMKAL